MFGIRKLESLGYHAVWHRLCIPIFAILVECQCVTDRHTHTHRAIANTMQRIARMVKITVSDSSCICQLTQQILIFLVAAMRPFVKLLRPPVPLHNYLF